MSTPFTSSMTSTSQNASPASYHHGNLKEALLQTAIQAISNKGHVEFSLSEIARGLGVTPAAAYKHFADKDALLSELAQHGFALLRQRFEQAAPAAQRATNKKQAIERFERIGQAYLQFGQEEPAFFHLIFGKASASYRKKATSSTERTPTFAYLAQALEDLHRLGVIAQAPTEQDQWFAWSAIHGATELVIASVGGLVPPHQAASTVTHDLLRAFAAPDSPAIKKP